MRKLQYCRSKGYDIDSVNPNNILLDKTNQTVNLVDLSLQNTRVTQNVTISLKDFEPFVDMKHASKVIQSAANYTDKTLIINKIKSFQDKIINISKKK